jgi:hypothetical protein
MHPWFRFSFQCQKQVFKLKSCDDEEITVYDYNLKEEDEFHEWLNNLTGLFSLWRSGYKFKIDEKIL